MRNRIAAILVLAGILTLISALLLQAGEPPATDIADLRPLRVTINSVGGGNFSSYSVPSAGATADLDFTKLFVTSNDNTIRFATEAEHGPWYIPLLAPPRVVEHGTDRGVERLRLIAEDADIPTSRVRIELQRFAEADNQVRVVFIHEYDGFIDSVAFGSTNLEPGQTLLRNDR